MNRMTIVAVVTVLTLGLAAQSSAMTRFNCTAGGKAWQITPGMWPIDVTIVVVKASTDCDLMVDDGFGTFLALGISMESGYESVRFGPLPGVPVRITALKASGPNSKSYLRGSDSLRFMGGGRNGKLRDLGSADELAARDPAYARALEKFKRYQRLKVGAAKSR